MYQYDIHYINVLYSNGPYQMEMYKGVQLNI